MTFRAAQSLLAALLLAAAASVRADCGVPEELRERWSNEAGIRVLWLEGGIRPDSGAIARRALAQRQRYDEVWLNSGGGDVDGGFDVGRALREHRATVRVRSHPCVRCASSCTNMMLGGYLRIVEPGANFHVHAASGVMNDQKSRAMAVGLKQFTERGAEGLREVVDTYLQSWVELSLRMVRYYQEVLGGQPNNETYAAIRTRHRIPSLYPNQRNLDRDVVAARAEGRVAVQEILTDVELTGMKHMLTKLREHEGELGRGGKVALRIFEATLSSRIQDSALLTQHQLSNLGYHNFDR
jgi:hypothetical protein